VVADVWVVVATARWPRRSLSPLPFQAMRTTDGVVFRGPSSSVARSIGGEAKTLIGSRRSRGREMLPRDRQTCDALGRLEAAVSLRQLQPEARALTFLAIEADVPLSAHLLPFRDGRQRNNAPGTGGRGPLHPRPQCPVLRAAHGTDALCASQAGAVATI
jgi:hypothetical protein